MTRSIGRQHARCFATCGAGNEVGGSVGQHPHGAVAWPSVEPRVTPSNETTCRSAPLLIPPVTFYFPLYSRILGPPRDTLYKWATVRGPGRRSQELRDQGIDQGFLLHETRTAGRRSAPDQQSGRILSDEGGGASIATLRVPPRAPPPAILLAHSLPHSRRSASTSSSSSSSSSPSSPNTCATFLTSGT